MNVHDPLVEMKITSVVCSVVAVAATVYRLIVRRDRLWVDDGWACFSMFVLFIQVSAVFMHVPNPAKLSRLNRIAAYYVLATTFYAIIWSARLSMLFAMIRLDHNVKRKNRLFYVAGLYLFVAIVLLAQLFWVCEREPGWKDERSPQCILNKQVAISQLVSDVIADLILLTVPLNLLAAIQDKKLRLRLIFIFSTSIVTTIVSLVHAAYIFTHGGTKVLISAIVEDCMSLFVCNLPVVFTNILKLGDGSQNSNAPNAFSTGLQFRSQPTAVRVTMSTFTDGANMRPEGEDGKATKSQVGEDQYVLATNLKHAEGQPLPDSNIATAI